MTIKSYLTNSYKKIFESRVIGQETVEGRVAIALEETCFYPPSGGQPADKGTINDKPVIDVYEKDGAIYHVLEAEKFDEDCARGRIDWERRFDHIQQHSGQHLLSAVLFKRHNIQTLSFHLGADYSAIDLSLKKMTTDMIEKVESECQRIILENRPMRVHIVNRDELHRFSLRKPPPEGLKEIRIIEIQDYDFSPCGGTHAKGTTEIGLIKIIGLEKIRKNIRVKFLCGNRANQDYAAKHRVLVDLSDRMTCSWQELPAIQEKVRAERKNFRRRIAELHKELARYEAKTMIDQAEEINGVRVISQILPNREMNELALLCKEIVSNPSVIALLAVVSDRVSLVFGRSENAPGQMGKLMKEACQKLGGRGGGRPGMAQGVGTRIDLAQAELRRIHQKVAKEL
ncbi:MAG: hypothetical protein B6244_05920 [Candidatus Cloacimonetes bacterium 4572_55]|nr:MAG: hypothetical protein B6244_05920 [Candidatus Cloacimonetes bacterium 4572_55]